MSDSTLVFSPPTSTGSLILIVESGPNQGASISLAPAGKKLVLGREESSCDLAFQSGNVSKRHATVEVRNDGIYLCDLQSTNGTYLLADSRVVGDASDKAVQQPTRILPGNRFRLGQIGPVILLHTPTPRRNVATSLMSPGPDATMVQTRPSLVVQPRGSDSSAHGSNGRRNDGSLNTVIPQHRMGHASADSFLPPESSAPVWQHALSPGSSPVSTQESRPSPGVQGDGIRGIRGSHGLGMKDAFGEQASPNRVASERVGKEAVLPTYHDASPSASNPPQSVPPLQQPASSPAVQGRTVQQWKERILGGSESSSMAVQMVVLILTIGLFSLAGALAGLARSPTEITVPPLAEEAAERVDP